MRKGWAKGGTLHVAYHPIYDGHRRHCHRDTCGHLDHRASAAQGWTQPGPHSLWVWWGQSDHCVIDQLSEEELPKDPEQISTHMFQTTRADLSRMGLEMISFTLKRDTSLSSSSLMA